MKMQAQSFNPIKHSKKEMDKIIEKYRIGKDMDGYSFDNLSLKTMLDEYANDRAVEFGKWMDNLLPSQRCTVHGENGTGLFDKTIEQLYLEFIKTK